MKMSQTCFDYMSKQQLVDLMEGREAVTNRAVRELYEVIAKSKSMLYRDEVSESDLAHQLSKSDKLFTQLFTQLG